MTVILRPTTDSDLPYFAMALRPDDRAEVAAHGWSPSDALVFGKAMSKPCVTAAEEYGAGIAIIGVTPSPKHGPEVGVIWMLATSLLTTWPAMRGLLKLTNGFLSECRDVYGYQMVHNLVDERNTVHIQWLKRIGATFIKRHPEAGPLRLPFLEFVKLL